MRSLPAPRFGAAGYERVGYGLLVAATPPGLASDYNKRRGELWVAFSRAAPCPRQPTSSGKSRRCVTTSARRQRREVCSAMRP